MRDLNPPSLPLQSGMLHSSFTPVPNSVFLNCGRLHTFPWANISLLSPLKLGCEPAPIPPSQGGSPRLQSYVNLSQSKSVLLHSHPLLHWDTSTHPISQFRKLSCPKATSHSLGFGYSWSLTGLPGRSEDHEDQCLRAGDCSTSLPQHAGILPCFSGGPP